MELLSKEKMLASYDGKPVGDLIDVRWDDGERRALYLLDAVYEGTTAYHVLEQFFTTLQKAIDSAYTIPDDYVAEKLGQNHMTFVSMRDNRDSVSLTCAGFVHKGYVVGCQRMAVRKVAEYMHDLLCFYRRQACEDIPRFYSPIGEE